jgi:hypothetical protein
MSNVATQDVTATIEAYFAMWNEADAGQRAKQIEKAWTEEGRYVDPGRDALGHAALSEMVAAVQPQFPGHTIERTSGIDAHHDQVRFGWKVVAPDGSVPVAGIDVGELAEDGRLRRISGFFGELPAA